MRRLHCLFNGVCPQCLPILICNSASQNTEVRIQEDTLRSHNYVCNACATYKTFVIENTVTRFSEPKLLKSKADAWPPVQTLLTCDRPV
jgi:RNase P subunit RPR2